MYQDGVGTERDIKRTAELYDKGCELGAGVACFNGAFLIDGDPRTTNPRALQLHDKARAAYRKSCDAGDLDWCTNLGVMLSMGIGQPKDEDGALVLFRKSCDARNVNGCIEVAQSMQRRQTKDDTDAARALLLDTCEREAGMACALAALMMSPSEEARVAELSERACDAGATLGCVTLARILVLRSPTLASPKATELLASSCDVGDSDACSLLALAKHQESDEATALQLERRACLIGDAKACVDGMLDAKKANDRPLAIELAIRLCELGDPSGCQLAKAASGSR